MSRWMVTGTQPVVIGRETYEPGSTFDADIEKVTQDFLVGIGAVSPAGKTDIKVPKAPRQAEFLPESEGDA